MSRPMHKCEHLQCTRWIPREYPYCLQHREKNRQGPNHTRIASRDEQHARYLDCGPNAWDDRD